MLVALLAFCLTCTSNSQLGNSTAGENRAIAKPGGFQLLVYGAPPPGNIEAIYLTVVSVDVVRQDGGIINISDKPATFNLLNYREGNPLELANKVIPSGRYSEIRLKLNEDNSIVVSGHTKSLKTPSAQQSGVKLKGHFEIVEGLLYTMRLHFDPNNSVVYNPGPDRYILKPVIEIAGNSLVDGPFTVTGLVENETVMAELKPDGTLRMIGTFDPKIELRGRYYFSFSTKALSLQLDDVLCSTCRGVGAVPGSVIYNLPATEIFVNFWDQSVIQGSVGSGLFVRSVVFEKTQTFALQTSADYSTINIEVNYPAALNGKFGIISLKPSAHSGRSFVDIQKIANEAATFTIRIPYREFPSRTAGSSKAYDVALMVADGLSRLKISGEDIGSVCGDLLLSTNGYALIVPIADKVLKTNLAFTINH